MENGWRSGVGSCIMSGLPMHLVQELNTGTVPNGSSMEICLVGLLIGGGGGGGGGGGAGAGLFKENNKHSVRGV